MSTPQGDQFVCDCGKKYRTQDSLRSHQRRYCRLNRQGDTSTSAEGTCPICQSEFASYMGMRQHMRHRHLKEYNDSLQNEARTARVAWTEDEENILARAEAEHSGENILDHLASISSRPVEALRKRRQLARYKEKVQKYKAEYDRKMQEMAAQLQNVHSPEYRRQQQEMEERAILRRDGELIEVVSSIPRSKLDGAGEEFRRKLTSMGKLEVVGEFELWCEALVQQFRSRKGSNGNARHRQMSPSTAMRSRLKAEKLSRHRRRALEYRLAQYEFRKDKTKYARHLLDGTASDSKNITPEAKDIETAYNDIFGSDSVEDNELITFGLENATDVSHPVTEEEIKQVFATSKTNTAGPDGMTLTDARKIPSETLLLLFNSILYLEYIPRTFRKSRTVLIPKTDQELHLVKNWRPITVSSILLRIFNKILTARLSSITLCDRQRGFTRIDGCFANFATLETLIKDSRKNAKPLTVISLDLTKAFDLVSHNSIQRALRRLRIDQKTTNIIAANYRDSETAILCNGQSICSCPVRRGVKQGDPMSPFLFNAVLDELLVQLNNIYSGVKVGSAKLSCLAYADDLILVANTPDDARRMLQHCYDFFNKRGLKVNASKCHSLVLKTVPGKKKLCVSTESSFDVDGEPIPPISVGDEFRYLGHMFNSEGMTECSSKKLAEQLDNIRKAPLKPQQKYVIVRDHLLPRYIAVLQRPNVSKKVLQKTDRLVRSALKTMLHLPKTCSDSIFYAPIKTGGLGIFQFSKMIPIITLSRWERLRTWSEVLEETYKRSEPWVNRYNNMISPTANTKETMHQKQEKDLQNSYSGGGIDQVKHHPACNSYLWRPPIYWSGEDFVRAVLLRFNLLPSKGIPSVPQGERRCRAGCFKTESLSHILQNCPLTHWWRIQRHDYVVNRLSNFAKKKGWTVNIEPHIRCSDGCLKKPDLIFEKDGCVIITDVGIHWEGEIPLTTQYQNKISLYSGEAFVNKIRQIYDHHNIYVLPLIVGARGGWCAPNNILVERLELANYQVADIITTTIRGSFITHSQFMRHVWR